MHELSLLHAEATQIYTLVDAYLVFFGALENQGQDVGLDCHS